MATAWFIYKNVTNLSILGMNSSFVATIIIIIFFHMSCVGLRRYFSNEHEKRAMADFEIFSE